MRTASAGTTPVLSRRPRTVTLSPRFSLGCFACLTLEAENRRLRVDRNRRHFLHPRVDDDAIAAGDVGEQPRSGLNGPSAPRDRQGGPSVRLARWKGPVPGRGRAVPLATAVPTAPGAMAIGALDGGERRANATPGRAPRAGAR